MQTFQLNCLWTCFLLCRAPFCRCMLHSDDDFKNGTPWDQLLCVHQNFCLKMGSSLRKVAILGGFDLSLISYAPLDIDTVLYAYIIYIYMYIYEHTCHLTYILRVVCFVFPAPSEEWNAVHWKDLFRDHACRESENCWEPRCRSMVTREVAAICLTRRSCCPKGKTSHSGVVLCC